MECLGLRNKPKAAMHPERKLTGPKKKKKTSSSDIGVVVMYLTLHISKDVKPYCRL